MQQSNTIQYRFSILPSLHGSRIDQALARILPEYSRSRIQLWIRQGDVTINGLTCQPKTKIFAHQTVDIIHHSTHASMDCAQPLQLDIIFEDQDLLVINKPAGLVVHPGAGHSDHTLLNALLHHAPELAYLPRAGMVHRLDKDTSGLLVVGRTLQAVHQLVKQLQARTIQRHYQAYVIGCVISGHTICAPIGRHPHHRTRMHVTSRGRPAITHYRVMQRFNHHTLLQVRLETGRTHQIRVHMMHEGYPLLGDPTYPARQLAIPHGASERLKHCLKNFHRQALHAAHLQFLHPRTQHIVTYTSPLPEDFQTLQKALIDDLQHKKS